MCTRGSVQFHLEYTRYKISVGKGCWTAMDIQQRQWTPEVAGGPAETGVQPLEETDPGPQCF